MTLSPQKRQEIIDALRRGTVPGGSLDAFAVGLEAVREEFAWLDTDGTVVMLDKYGEAEWWTFAGAGANATLAYALSQAIESRITYDSFTVTVESQASVNTIKQTLAELRARCERDGFGSERTSHARLKVLGVSTAWPCTGYVADAAP